MNKESPALAVGVSITLLLNVIMFGLAAWLVEGFRLRWGFISALLGAFVLSLINSIIFHLNWKSVINN